MRREEVAVPSYYFLCNLLGVKTWGLSRICGLFFCDFEMNISLPSIFLVKKSGAFCARLQTLASFRLSPKR